MEKQRQYLSFDKKEMAIWDAFDFLNQLVDDSDPDTDLDQFQHLLQTSEAIRRDGHPDWMVLVGLMHDMGKVLCLFGEPQWAVVGDTFPVGCAYSDKIKEIIINQFTHLINSNTLNSHNTTHINPFFYSKNLISPL
jgi:inositol oxygenase